MQLRFQQYMTKEVERWEKHGIAKAVNDLAVLAMLDHMSRQLEDPVSKTAISAAIDAATQHIKETPAKVTLEEGKQMGLF